MEYVSIPQLEKKASRFVMGTFGMFPDENIEKHMSVLDAAFELGINTIDTARAYDSEPTVGRWIRERGNREKIVLISKGAHPSNVRERVTPYDIDSDLFETLATLGTDYLDIYMLHRDNPELPVGPIVEKLNEHHAAGRMRCFGGSNWTDRRLNEANEYAYAHNLVPMAVSSPNYSLAEQVENPWAPGCVTISGPQNEEARAWYEKNQMPVFAYSSLARGLFSGRVSRSVFQNTPEEINQFCRKGYCYECNFIRLDRCEEIAAEKNATIPQVAMAFVLDSPLNVFPIIGAANRSEIESSLGAMELKLTPKEIAYLDLKSDTRQ